MLIEQRNGVAQPSRFDFGPGMQHQGEKVEGFPQRNAVTGNGVVGSVCAYEGFAKAVRKFVLPRATA